MMGTIDSPSIGPIDGHITYFRSYKTTVLLYRNDGRAERPVDEMADHILVLWLDI